MKIDVKELVPSYFSKGEELKKIGGAKTNKNLFNSKKMWFP